MPLPATGWTARRTPRRAPGLWAVAAVVVLLHAAAAAGQPAGAGAAAAGQAAGGGAAAGAASAAGTGAGPGAASVASAPRLLLVPVEGVPPSALRDTWSAPRGDDKRHEAIDIAAPLGTRVLAADDGRVVKLFTSARGGLTVYQFDRDDGHVYYYAHLDRYAEGLKEGMTLKRGDLVGYVGTTGNAAGVPHLHFAVLRLGPERRWWEGVPVNPYPLLVPGAAR